ncbi:AraC family transcriptional regulator [Rapidithrix thailandica]|uniref:AraC family transcriptional regulator n=1 Tax=Rapidithrix thailandica TaxID=413964 RepID=A0AAW9SGA1_9BACT
MEGYFEIPVAPALQPFIKCYWALEVPASQQSSIRDRVPPLGFQDLLINYGDPFQIANASSTSKNELLLVGQFTKYHQLQYSGKIGLFSICFRPFGWSLLTGYPADEFTNIIVPVELLMPSIKELTSRLQEAPDNLHRVQLANSFLQKAFLEKQLSTSNIPIQSIVHTIDLSKGNIQIGDLASTYCCSVSKFERNFKHYTGLTPKQYGKLARFRQVLTTYSPHTKALDIYKLGYYDQSHFIREFKQLIGVAPKSYFSGELYLSEKCILEKADFLQSSHSRQG